MNDQNLNWRAYLVGMVVGIFCMIVTEILLFWIIVHRTSDRRVFAGASHGWEEYTILISSMLAFWGGFFGGRFLAQRKKPL
jgi:hypothetical protein